jgi:hypothetical protein
MKNITRHLRTDRDIAAAPGRKVSRDYCGATKKQKIPPPIVAALAAPVAHH